MQVLLRERVSRLGAPGDIVDVADGYARNHLLPHGLAMQVKPGQVKAIEAERRRLARKAEKERLENEEMAAKLADASVTITARATEEGHLFGSVDADDIARAITEEVAPVDASAVRLEEPLKNLGVYEVTIHLSGEVEATTKVWVVGE